jgi:chemotaxis protein CheZ
MSVRAAPADSDELEDLFDSIAHAQSAPDACVEAPAKPVEPVACAENRVLNSVGRLTRQLHDTLAKLGYDRSLECAAATLPDARQRLHYVVTVTEQAATRSLTAVELATPLQESLASDASALGQRWDALLRGEASVDEFKSLAHATRDYLHAVPASTDATRGHLREIVMAQEFQDLTGQVLKRITDLAGGLETQLLKLLVEHAPVPVRDPEVLGLLNGPAIGGGTEIVANQAQVDELLESLGF